MIIAGLQRLTLLDFPEHVACTVFTWGCNFRCPFCHNSALVLPDKIRGEDMMDTVMDGIILTISILRTTITL